MVKNNLMIKELSASAVKQIQARMQDKLDAVSAALDDFNEALSDAEDCLYELVDLIQQYEEYEEYETKENR